MASVKQNQKKWEVIQGFCTVLHISVKCTSDEDINKGINNK